MNINDLLDNLLKNGEINLQQYKTYKGQVKHGDEAACRLGLKRKGLLHGEKESRTEETDT